MKPSPKVKWTVAPLEYRDNGEIKYFPSVLLGYRPGLKYMDGSGSDASMLRGLSMTINIGPDPEDFAKGIVTNTMEECVANAKKIAAVPDLIEALLGLVNRAAVTGDLESAGSDEDVFDAARAALENAGVL